MTRMPAPIPSRIGSYLVRGVVGSGAMGIVYLAHDPAIDRPVVVKTIHRRLLESSDDEPGVTARFRVEAQAAGRLTHRNIVSVYQFGEDNDCAYIVMEYVAGRNLRDYIHAPRKLEVSQVLCLMGQLLDGLHYAHERGIVLNLLLYLLVIRPVTTLSKLANRVSLGEPDVPEFKTHGHDEIGTLAQSFARMRHSLDQAIKMQET